MSDITNRMDRELVDRATERGVLEAAWASGRPELVVMHGRRRVGKTELLKRFAADRPVAMFVAAQQHAVTHLADLGAILGPLVLGQPPSADGPRLALDGWDAALRAVQEAAGRRRIGLVLDEFPYLCEAEPALPSLIQRWWDAAGSGSDLVVVLAGSEQAMMLQVTSGRGALYGRPTRSMWIRPFDYYMAGRFVPGWR